MYNVIAEHNLGTPRRKGRRKSLTNYGIVLYVIDTFSSLVCSVGRSEPLTHMRQNLHISPRC